MQRFYLLLACFLLSMTCIAQQYPFVHYTPKDGLISNRITRIYQDREGRLYFTSFNGLSVYDGARFTNYTAENGLDNNIINCILEMGHDSIWVVTNKSSIYSLVKGKLKKVEFSDSTANLAIDNLFRDDQGIIYAASEQGLFVIQHNQFIKLRIEDANGRDISSYISHIIPVNQYLLIQRDNSMLNDADKFKLYLYDTSAKKIIAQTQQEKIFGANRSPDGRIWVSTDLTILSIDTLKLKQGKIVLHELNSIFSDLKNKGNHFIFFDHEGNAWLTNKASALLKADVHGHVTLFGSDSGLSTTDVNQVFQDQENIIWIATNSAGVDKMVNSNFSFSTTPFGLPIVNFISYTEEKNQIWLYSVSNAKAISMEDNNIQYYHVENADQFGQLVETSHGLFGISAKSIYKIWRSGFTLNSKILYADSVTNEFIGPLEDQNGNLFLGGKYHLTVIINGEKIYQKKIDVFVDYASLDTAGNIWTVSRGNELILYKPQPADPVNYLEQNLSFTTELSGISPRSFVIDHYNTFWIGTRSSGVYAYQLKGGVLTSLYHLTSSSGLSENFVSYLAVDKENHIWACTPSGLDKISIRDGTPVVENLTKQNNIYQTIHKVVFDQDNTAWALFPNGLIKITPENKILTDYSPLLRMVTVKAGMDTVDEQGLATLTHQQNNLTFYFAAPTYLDEKQVLYTYRLQGRNTTMWSEPSSLAYASFIELRPGHYTLYVKASFPAGRYPEQTIQYKFYITPPWWQTNWFRLMAGICIAGLFVLLARYYYRRKLIIQRRILEKQQVIEKERTRIATDMHDDLGAGLSRIKFLSQSLRNKSTNDNGIKSGLEKITEFSDEMTEKMGEIVWALNEKNDTLADLVAYIRSYAVEYLSNHHIECEAHTPPHLPNTFIPGEVRRNLFLAVKESLHNIVKHAGATHVDISIELNEKILIVIHDNGKGIDWDHQRPLANGLQNIRKRMFDIKGNADFVMDKGTKVSLLVPLNI